MNLKIIKIFISSGLVFLGTISNSFAQEESVAIFRKGDSYYFNSLNKKDRSYRRNMRVEMYQRDTSYDFLSKSIIKKNTDGNLIANDNKAIVEKSSKNHRLKTHRMERKLRKHNGNNIYLAAKGGASFPANFKGNSSEEVFGFTYPWSIHGELRNGATYELAIGKKLNRWRVEGAINKSKTNLQDPIRSSNNWSWVTAPQRPNLEMTSYMLNLYRDIKFNPSHKLSPYIGVGAGLSNVKFDESEYNQSSRYKYEEFSGNLFSYNFKGGFNYQLSKRYSMFTEASFNKINSFKINNKFSGVAPLEVDPLKSTNIMTGIRLDF